MAAQKDSTDILRPIPLILDDANYLHWAQQMRRFLQGRRLWGYIKYAYDLVSKSGVSSNDTVMSRMEENWEHYTLTGNSLISRRSKKQSIVSRSSTESEYHALADINVELVWLRWLLGDMGVPFDYVAPIHYS
ncbi:hypothetical protein RJ639_009821 [Escallonia herrerae]|uniref:Retrotransposon Copia-like N-terminal domain-containing protein n=1 Tax=Escallonia herrerae TaxID=1293975 RepID=A0AA88VV22_9ASTE|nr:hypothetical protein RJ639_009821 [Escallonia herrerae]